MSNSPLISVLLPFYNAEATLDRAIASIINQSYTDFELILIDNNSDDKSHEIALKWVSKDHRIKLIEENLQGVVHATNTGADIARGMYISRMDSDDEAIEKKLTLQKEYLDEHPDCDAVAGMVEHVPYSEKAAGFSRFVEWSNSILSYQEIYNNRFIELPLVNPTLMWRKDIALQHGLYRFGDFPEDYEMILRWLNDSVRIEKIPEIVLKWYDSETRLTRTDNIYSDKSFYEIKSKYLAEWLKNNNPFHPKVAVWGASRISRRRARLLEPYGIEFQNYIDTKKGRQVGKEIIYYEDLPPAGSMFILSYIRQMDNRDRIRDFLNERGYEEGVDYLMGS
jgi:glycosyltransferase involved in cell wall biosynthesis